MKKVVIGNAELWLGDCAEVIPNVSGVDLVLTDPPYGVSHDKSGAGKRYKVRKMIVGDEAPPDMAWAMAHKAIIWGGNCFDLPRSTGWLVWDKCHSDKSQHSQAELAWTSVVRTVRHYREAYHGFMRQRDGWFHPTQKPVGLMRWCLGLAGADCQVAFDPYMGSGPVGVACAELGRRYIGVEKDPEFFEIACRRIEDAARQERWEMPPMQEPQQVHFASVDFT